MGTFKIEITATGGHGLDREKKDGEKVDFYKEGPYTIEAQAKLLVEVLRSRGCTIQDAKIIHWPGEPSQVTDSLDTGIRTGNF